MADMIYSAADIASFGTILGLWAHPDDESWSMAGIMAVARQNGQRVVCVTATSGEAGQSANEAAWPIAELKKIRRQELETAMKQIAVTEHVWLDYKDGAMDMADQTAAVQEIMHIISNIRPDTIFTFEPDGITGHQDHKAISSWACSAVKQLNLSTPVYGAIELAENYESFGKRLDEKFNIYFKTDKPNLVSKNDAAIYFKLPTEILHKKIECLRAQPSQTAGMFAEPEMAACIRCMAGSEQFTRLSSAT